MLAMKYLVLIVFVLWIIHTTFKSQRTIAEPKLLELLLMMVVGLAVLYFIYRLIVFNSV